MNYDELIVKARKGRSVSAMAADLGMTKMTLNRYVRGTHVPDYRTATLIAREARVSLGEVMAIMTAKEEELKGAKEIITTGFRLLTNALNGLYTRVCAV
ncbi:MAG TPA: helix-turn-helix transcriptional regulator [Paraburkholderia sp.]|nr:helix-turn-helix transcriptional regulator [Paraburkholderia sp.]